MSLNRAILVGNVGRDPEVRSTQSGDRVASFSVATSESWKDKTTGERKEQTDWHNIVVFNQNLIPVIEQYVKKGSKVSIEGKIKTRKYQHSDGSDRYSTEIVIGRFDGALGLEGSPAGARQSEDGYGETRSRSNGPSSSSNSGSGYGRPSGNNGGARPLNEQIDDDIPF